MAIADSPPPAIEQETAEHRRRNRETADRLDQQLAERIKQTKKESRLMATAELRAVRVPEPIDFGSADFMPAPEIDAIGIRLIDGEAAFAHLSQAEITYLWKSKGGQSKGKSTLGKCQKPSGLLKHFAECDFVIWVAADHARDLQLDSRQMEALVFHELCHAELDEDEETGVSQFTIRGHDVEAFAAEIKRYGLWKEDLREMGAVIRQLRLEDHP